MLLKTLIAVCLTASCMSVQALPVYSSILSAERSGFCKKVEATASHVAEDGLKKYFKNILFNTKSLPKNDFTTLWDVLYLADQRRSSWWAYEMCMDRLET